MLSREQSLSIGKTNCEHFLFGVSWGHTVAIEGKDLLISARQFGWKDN
jgi:xylose isomerase